MKHREAVGSKRGKKGFRNKALEKINKKIHQNESAILILSLEYYIINPDTADEQEEKHLSLEGLSLVPACAAFHVVYRKKSPAGCKGQTAFHTR